MASKTVLILGAGVGGLAAANELRRLLPREHRIVLVEKNARHAFAPSFLWLITGDRRPEQISCDVRELVRPGIEIIVSEAQAIDLANCRVQTSPPGTGRSETYIYDYQIVALGAELAPEAMPGPSTGSGQAWAEGAHTFYTLDGATKLRDALRAFNGGKVAVVVRALLYKCPAPRTKARCSSPTRSTSAA